MGTWGRILLSDDNCASPNVTQNTITGNAGTATKITTITNSEIVLRTDAQTITNKDITATALSVGANTDLDIPLGRARLQSSVASDQPMLSHYDHDTLTNYSWSQNASGKTIINAVSGQTIDFRVNNVTECMMDGSGNFHADGDITAYSTSTSSDRRLKKEIQQMYKYLMNFH